jgi:hypothetical protein
MPDHSCQPAGESIGRPFSWHQAIKAIEALQPGPDQR